MSRQKMLALMWIVAVSINLCVNLSRKFEGFM